MNWEGEEKRGKLPPILFSPGRRHNKNKKEVKQKDSQREPGGTDTPQINQRHQEHMTL